MKVTKEIIPFFLRHCIRTLLLVAAGLIFAVTLGSVMNVEFISSIERGISKPLMILDAELLGFISPGPRYILYPILVKLKELGVDYCVIIALISGHVLIEPSTFFLEYGFFGYRFPLKRFIASLIITYLAGLVTLFILG